MVESRVLRGKCQKWRQKENSGAMLEANCTIVPGVVEDSCTKKRTRAPRSGEEREENE